MKKTVYIMLLLLVMQTGINSKEAGKELFFLDTDWKLAIGLDGFVIKKNVFDEENNYLEIFAENRTTGLLLSVFFEKAEGDGDSTACRGFYMNRMKNGTIKRSAESTYDKNGFAVYDYMIEEYQGYKINQRNLNIYMSVSGTWIDVHISKVNYAKSDDAAINSFIDSLAITSKTSGDFYSYGSYYFYRDNYRLAAKYYEKALELEHQKRLLSKEDYYILIDNLGMAYGIAGDYSNSERVFLFGITVDPQYPMFYYNLACCYAEKGDTEKFLLNLENSLKYRKNMIKGEKFPDPEKDNSFKNYINNERFKALVKKYGAGGA